MYLKKIRLQNIKCFEDVTLEFPHTNGDSSGWNVILGENGLGKSTLVRAVAELVMELHESSWIFDEDWVSSHVGKGRIEAVFTETWFDDPELRGGGSERGPTAGAPKKLWLDAGIERLKRERDQTTGRAKKINSPGWLACGYGPFRRLDWQPPAFQLKPYQLPFLTMLSDAAGIAEPISWLKTVYARSLDKKVVGGDVFRQALPVFERIINQLLPQGVRIKDVSTQKVLFETAEGVELEAIRLSDGFRSFLALVLDLMMHTFNATVRFEDYMLEDKETGAISILAEGIVLIDEADAHLHPSWQRELGERLRQVFPKIQFIVTTHSPFIAQEATDGGLFVLRRNENGTVEVEKFEESVRGWTATQILTSPRLFGLHSTRSVETEHLVSRNTELLAKQNAGKLTTAEKRELAEIKAALESRLSAPGETYEEMQRQTDMSRYVDETLKRLTNDQK
ncbi:MAG: AAA family ATPase [Planctomycetia bacterium]|nr:AAA family ATPase [Planctomycetia bacterium]